MSHVTWCEGSLRCRSCVLALGHLPGRICRARPGAPGVAVCGAPRRQGHVWLLGPAGYEICGSRDRDRETQTVGRVSGSGPVKPIFTHIRYPARAAADRTANANRNHASILAPGESALCGPARGDAHTLASRRRPDSSRLNLKAFSVLRGEYSVYRELPLIDCPQRSTTWSFHPAQLPLTMSEAAPQS